MFLPIKPCTLAESRVPIGASLVGQSQAIQKVREYIRQVANCDANVLITGETGTGKELVARSIHYSSARRCKPYISFNAAAIPDSLLESELFGHAKGAFTGADTLRDGKLKSADGGTILFDEIGDMSPFLQAKLLRCLEARVIQRLGSSIEIPLDVRVLAATNLDLAGSVETGNFRRDLYYRLNVVRIQLPPLRERSEDIIPLLEYFVAELSRTYDKKVTAVAADVIESFLKHNWPGNIRELKNLLEATFVTLRSPDISLEDLPSHYFETCNRHRDQDSEERARILSSLSAHNWNKSLAAKALAWSRMTLYRKLKKYQIRDGWPVSTGKSLPKTFQ